MVAFAQGIHPSQSDALLPSLTLTRAREVAHGLERWIQSEEAISLPLHELECEQERRNREVQRLFLQAHIEARALGDVGSAIERGPEGSAELLPHREIHGCPIVSIFGPVRVECLSPQQAVGESKWNRETPESEGDGRGLLSWRFEAVPGDPGRCYTDLRLSSLGPGRGPGAREAGQTTCARPATSVRGGMPYGSLRRRRCHRSRGGRLAWMSLNRRPDSAFEPTRTLGVSVCSGKVKDQHAKRTE